MDVYFLCYRHALMDLIIAMVAYSTENCIQKVYDATIPLLQVCTANTFIHTFIIFIPYPSRQNTVYFLFLNTFAPYK